MLVAWSARNVQLCRCYNWIFNALAIGAPCEQANNGELHVCTQGSVLSNISDLRSSMSGGSSWIGHGTAMGPERWVKFDQV